jgi:ankyrin repeat protein
MTRQLDMIDELLARGADIKAQRSDGARPIQLTHGDYTYRGWRDVPNWLRMTPLHHFAEKGDVEKAAIFIEHGADVNTRDEELCSTPLGYAAK